MGNIDLTALEIFKTVAEQGSITKAAARLHRVQSNVTTRVKQLEERLGAQLFLRQHRRLVLSPQGKRLLGDSELVLIAPKSFPRIKTRKDIGHTTLIAFATGCSYRRRLEAWLGSAQMVPERVMEFGSYHAIVACVAAGAGIAVVPRSVLRVSRGERDVTAHPLPAAVAKARTCLLWPRRHQSIALDALRAELRKASRTSHVAS